MGLLFTHTHTHTFIGGAISREETLEIVESHTTMADTDWSSLVTSHGSSKGDLRGWVGRYFAQWGDRSIERAQDVLDSAALAVEGETPSRLQVLRAFFQFAPSGLWVHVVLRPFVVEWVCCAACNRGAGALSVPLRGVAMSILGYFVKCGLKGSDSSVASLSPIEAGKAGEVAAAGPTEARHPYAPIAQAVATMLSAIAEDLLPADGGSELPFASALLLHQCVETLEAAGEAQAPWLAAAADGLDSAALVLQHQCHPAAAELRTQTAVQAQVDAAKAFGMVAEVWMARRSAAGGGKVEKEGEEAKVEKDDDESGAGQGRSCAALRTLPRGLLSFAASGLIVHDAILGAFHSALDVVLALDGGDPEVSWNFVSALLQQGLAIVDSGVLEDVMNVHRMEMVVGMVGCLVPALRVWAEEGRALTAAEEVIGHITSLQPRMQAAVQQSSGADEAHTLRGALGDLRRGCISVCEAVITSVPIWVCAHRQVYWDLCLRVLRTSALFAAAFCAMRWQASHAHAQARAAGAEDSPADEDAGSGVRPTCTTVFTATAPAAEEAEVPYADVEILLTHVCTAVQQVERYSDPAAQDVLSCLVNLCECDCKYLVMYPDKHPITAAIVAAYDKSPRGSKARRAGWKVAVLCAMKDLFSLQAKHPSNTEAAGCPLPQSSRALFLQLVVREVELLRLALGRNSKEARGAREALGSTETDELHLLLHHLTAALVTFLRIPRCLCADEPSAADDKSPPCVALLRSYLQSVYSQPPRGSEFEEDLVQACMELETVAHAVSALVAETQAREDVLPAVRAICLAGGVDAALVRMGATARGEGEGVAFDMSYETAREALLFIATALLAPGEEADSSFMGALFRALPLAVDCGDDCRGGAESADAVEALFVLKLGL